MTEIVIQTDKSFLSLTKFNKNTLIKQCVENVAPLLDIYPPIKIFGKIKHQRRDVGFFSNDSAGYKYSGQFANSKPLTPSLLKLLQYINKKYGAIFNGILINRYNTGEDYISAHSDDERNLDAVGVVAISYGSERIFRIRDIKTREIIEDICTDNNTIIHMGGNFQKEFTHEIPIQKHIDDIRYSFTFRKHLE